MTTATEEKLTSDQLDQLAVNAIRVLAMDGVGKANSGHPGMPMGMAAIAYTLWAKHLRFNPKNPNWFDRDRFILSNGHGSMLHYSLLHLSGFDLPLEQLQQFRQWGSHTPGHPERGMTPGIEVTTGPLGQGFANGVGMGIAEAFLAATYNKPGHELINHYTYVFAGDGCMEEGISHEAASLAGHLKLGKLIYFYDDNQISIDGNTDITFTENVNKRFEAYGWHVQDIADGNDIAALDGAIKAAKEVTDKPSLIVCHTIIGYGSPTKQGTGKVHGNPLKPDEILAAKQFLGYPSTEPFFVPEEARQVFRAAGERGAQLETEWKQKFQAYKEAEAELGQQLENAISRKLAPGWDSELAKFAPKDGPIATRNASSKALNSVAKALPTLIGGSADLNESTFTKLEAYPEFSPNDEHGTYDGRTINWGVREHGMGAAVNGMAAHGGVWPYGATFFVFSDYMRPSVRLSAIMEIPSIFVWTHDSVGVGEDGPTHQPVEHLMVLRAIPGFTVIRPGDANETSEAWRTALQMDGPVGLIFTRQKLPVFDREKFAPANGLAKGAYILSEAQGGTPQLILIATGSEVSLAVDAQAKLQEGGVATRVVSMPSFELFEQQSEEYQEQVLPEDVTARLSLELGIGMGWERWVGPKGASLSIDHFGASAPYERVLKEFGYTVENVVAIGQQLLKDPKGVKRQLRENQRKFSGGGHISSAPAAGDEGHS